MKRVLNVCLCILATDPAITNENRESKREREREREGERNESDNVSRVLKRI